MRLETELELYCWTLLQHMAEPNEHCTTLSRVMMDGAAKVERASAVKERTAANMMIVEDFENADSSKAQGFYSHALRLSNSSTPEDCGVLREQRLDAQAREKSEVRQRRKSASVPLTDYLNRATRRLRCKIAKRLL